MSEFIIQQEKIAQAVGILNEKKVDVWMTFVRETIHNADPAKPLVLPFEVTWQTALIIAKSGAKIAITGRYDVENIKRSGLYDEVIGYDQSIQPELIKVLDRLNPQEIAVNYSESDSAADGLSHGMYLTLARYFEGKPYRMISAEDVLNALRGRKSPSELARIRAAVAMTDEITDRVTAMLKPGMSEKQIADWIHNEFAKRGVIPSWDGQYCPTVNCGADSAVGHVSPSATTIAKPGDHIHIDYGVVLNDYISDIQRMWYLQPAGETTVNPEVQRAFEIVNRAIDAAVAVLKPGVQGWVADAAARQVIVEAGYPEYKHALGHGIGRTVHDGSTLLGPKWERYGNSPDGIVEVGQCYTLEPSIIAPGLGIVSLEEDVVITEHGVEWLGKRQTELMIVPC